MKIKICGLKTVEDSLAACEAGADFLGFNFYPYSVRYISLEDCRSIVNKVRESFPGILCVGIFVNQAIEEIQATLDFCRLDLAQLSGTEPEHIVRKLGDLAIKAIRPKNLEDARSMIEEIPERGSPPAFLLDTYAAAAYGGTGEVGDWGIAERIAGNYSILLAGGLNLGNIASAIEKVKPWGVDVASGVESVRGEKDPLLIEAFINSVREFTHITVNNS